MSTTVVNTQALLAERGKTHGDFSDHARVTLRLKEVIVDEVKRRQDRRQPALTLCMRESLDMIVHKIGRILAGKADHQDHWDDIAGYAKLVSERCGPEVACRQALDRVDQVAPPACPDLDQEILTTTFGPKEDYATLSPGSPVHQTAQKLQKLPRNYGNSGSVGNEPVTGIDVEWAEPESN